MTAYGAVGSAGQLGVLLVNKGDALAAAIVLSGRDCSGVGALGYDADIHAAGGGPAELAASCSSGTVSVDLPRLSVVGLVLEWEPLVIGFVIEPKVVKRILDHLRQRKRASLAWVSCRPPASRGRPRAARRRPHRGPGT